MEHCLPPRIMQRCLVSLHQSVTQLLQGILQLVCDHTALHFQVAGGPKIPLRFGRKDAEGPESAVPEGNLPGTFVAAASSLALAQLGTELPGLRQPVSASSWVCALSALPGLVCHTLSWARSAWHSAWTLRHHKVLSTGSWH